MIHELLLSISVFEFGAAISLGVVKSIPLTGLACEGITKKLNVFG
jgi:hypothetical protein